MKYLTSFLLTLVVFLNYSSAQTPNWSEDIATIIYNNCTQCHHSNGIAPFALESYADAYAERFSIANVMVTGEMPPWPPDTSYQRYTHERTLTDQERNKIINWVTNGAPEGDASLAPCPPDFSQGTFLGTPDLELTIPTYTSKATSSSDDYVCFSLPSGLTTDRYVEAVEIVPGSPDIVHHVIIYIDGSGSYSTDTIGGDCMGPNTNAPVLGAYAPGGLPTVFPNSGGTKMGVKIPAGANIILAMHYPEGSAGQKDSTSIHLFFYPTNVTGVREVTVAPVGYDFSFCVPPNQLFAVNDNNQTPISISVLSVFPHMHLLGQSIKSFAVTLANDTIPLIDIPAWDFEWQGFYTFRNLLKIPAGSTIYSSGTYDNTTNNPNNPNNPPQTVCAGLNTTDEMFIMSIQFTTYQSGDENISLEDILAPPQPTVTASGTTICNGSTVMLTADPGYASYRWCPGGETTQSISVSSGGAYYVEVKDNKGISGNSNTIVVQEGATVAPTVNDEEICDGESANLTASGGVSYVWSTGGNSSGIVVSPSATTTYSVTSTDANGCTASADATVTVHDNPVATLQDMEFCAGPTVNLDPGTWSAYSWSTGSNTQSIAVGSTGTYTVTVTDQNGCTTTASSQITVNPLPPVFAGNDVTICAGETATLVATGASTYSWSNGVTTDSNTVSPTVTTNYSVTGTSQNGCIADHMVMVIVNDNPTVGLQDATFCQGSSVVLDAQNPGASYNWSTGATSKTITVNTAGTYSVTVTNASGCTATDDAIVSIGTSLSVNLPDAQICQGESVMLDAGHPGATYTWSTGATTQTITTSTAGSYSVTVTDPNNCTGSDMSQVTVNALPSATAGPNMNICDGESVNLTAGGGTTYSWSNGMTGANITVSPTTNTTYTVTVTDANGCTNTANAGITVDPNPVVDIADESLCQGESATLDAGNPGATYNWSTGASTQTITVTSAGTYSVTVSDQNSCTGFDSGEITVSALPQVSAGMNDTICAGETATLNASGGTSYEWNTGANTGSINVSPTNTTNYSVTATDANGCSASANVSVVVKTCIGIEDVTALNPDIYPNPTTGKVNISIDKANFDQLEIEVLNVQGKLVYQESIKQMSGLYALDLSKNAKGIYFLLLRSKDDVITKKIALQ